MADIKQIKVSNGTVYDIDAQKWGGHTFSEIEGLIHGVVDTYVIPTTKSSTSGYTGVVGATTTQVSTTIGTLKGLVSNPPSNSFDKFNVGDVVLMGASSDGTQNFDRWISNISGTGDAAVVTLDVLETQVAKHHHSVNVITSVSGATAKALTGSNTPTYTATNVAKVGSSVTVLTGESDDYVTSVNFDDNGSDTLTIASGTSTDGVGHSHTVNSHTHSISFTPSTYVSRSIEAYTSLDTADHTPHTHTVVSAAGKKIDGTKFTYVNGGSTGVFVQSLTDAATATNTGGTTNLTTNSNTTALSTSAQTSSDTIGDIVKTKEAGGHSHSLSSAETASVVTSATVATSVVTSVTLTSTAPNVASTVVTAVSCKANTASTVISWGCSVDTSGILSFTAETGNRATGITMTSSTAKQSAGSISISAPRSSQSVTAGKVAVSGTISTSGAHSHGFSHTHAIPAHTHGIASHTHTYYKTVASVTGSAYTSLTTADHTPHTHSANVSVASTSTNGTKFTYVTGGTKTSVVRDMKGSSQSITTTSAAPSTDTKYYKLDGKITFPGLTIDKKTISTKSITPAADGGAKAITAITFTSANFVNSINVSNGDVDTTVNEGGKGNA